MTTVITAGLLRIARAIGRWIIERLARWALDHLGGYMMGKIDDFKRRLARAKTARRKRWLTGRIRRWSTALKWLSINTRDIESCAGEEFDALARRNPGIPVVASCEKLAGA